MKQTSEVRMVLLFPLLDSRTDAVRGEGHLIVEGQGRETGEPLGINVKAGDYLAASVASIPRAFHD